MSDLDDISYHRDRSRSGPARSEPASVRVRNEDHESEGAPAPSTQDARSFHSEDEPARDRILEVAAARDLHWWDVAALIINKMVGTGIFTGPPAVLAATQNKSHAIVFWVLGASYSLASTWMYLEYSRDLMYNGGELIYLDYTLTRRSKHPSQSEKSSRWKFPQCRMFAYTLYASYFVLLYNTSTNAMQFARQVLIAHHPTDMKYEDLNQPVLRLIAVVVSSGSCLLIYFSASSSIIANWATAGTKLILLIAVISSGGYYLSHNEHGPVLDDWATTAGSSPNWTLAMLLVFFSFHGWDNATLVAGDIPKYSVLRLGFFVAVAVVSLLYISIAVLVGLSFTWEEGPPQDYIAMWFGDSSYAVRGSAIMIAISALGSMISVTYTCTRVKQLIAWTSILPWAGFWRRSAARHSEDPQRSRPNPEGGTVLHWLADIFFITVTASIHHLQSAISFPGNLLVYGHFIAETAVGLAFAFSFEPGKTGDSRSTEFGAPSPPTWLRPESVPRLGPLLLGGIPAIFSCI